MYQPTFSLIQSELDKIQLSKELTQIFKQIPGYRVFLHGGAIRDLLLGIKVNDWDLKTNIPNTELKKWVGIIPGLMQPYTEIPFLFRFVTRDDKEYEIFCFEQKPNQSLESALKNSAATCDFTVNALAIPLNFSEDGEIKPVAEILDFFNGQNDLKNKCLRSIEHPTLAFGQQELNDINSAYKYSRIFRMLKQTGRSLMEQDLVWFCTVEFKKEIINAVKKLHGKYKNDIKIVKPLYKGFASGYGEKVFTVMNDLQIADYIFPDYQATKIDLEIIVKTIDRMTQAMASDILSLGELYALLFWPSFCAFNLKNSSFMSGANKPKIIINRFLEINNIKMFPRDYKPFVKIWCNWVVQENLITHPTMSADKFFAKLSEKKEKEKNTANIFSDKESAIRNINQNDKTFETKTTVVEGKKESIIEDFLAEPSNHNEEKKKSEIIDPDPLIAIVNTQGRLGDDPIALDEHKASDSESKIGDLESSEQDKSKKEKNNSQEILALSEKNEDTENKPEIIIVSNPIFPTDQPENKKADKITELNIGSSEQEVSKVNITTAAQIMRALNAEKIPENSESPSRQLKTKKPKKTTHKEGINVANIFEPMIKKTNAEKNNVSIKNSITSVSMNNSSLIANSLEQDKPVRTKKDKEIGGVIKRKLDSKNKKEIKQTVITEIVMTEDQKQKELKSIRGWLAFYDGLRSNNLGYKYQAEPNYFSGKTKGGFFRKAHLLPALLAVFTNIIANNLFQEDNKSKRSPGAVWYIWTTIFIILAIAVLDNLFAARIMRHEKVLQQRHKDLTGEFFNIEDSLQNTTSRIETKR